MRLLLRVRVDDEVGLIEAGDVGDVEARTLERLDARGGDDVDRVDLVRLERGDHGVVVREHPQAELVDLRLRAPVGGLPLEESDLVLLVLDERERAGADDRRVVREGLQVGAVVAGVLAPDVLGQDEELLELAEYVPGRLLVVDDERRRVRRVGLGDVRDQAGLVRGAAARVLDVRVDRPRGIFRGQGLPVAPLGALDEVKRPGLAAL